MYALKRCLAFLLLSGSSSLAPAPRPSGRSAALPSADTAAKANAQSFSRRPSGRTPSFTSQDLTHLVQNELAPKPWLPPTLSFKTDFPKTVAAVDDLKDSLKKSVERIPIYRSAQSVARRARDTLVVRKGSAAPEQRAPAAPPRSQSRAPGLTSQDVASFVERELPSTKAKD